MATAKINTETKELLTFGKWDAAIKELQQPKYQDDSEALFLLASAMRKKSHPLGVDAGPILLKAAELGSPWAMWSLAQKNNCKWYGWPCGDIDWKEKAAKRFAELAAQGDAQAVYFASDLRAYWQRYIPFYANVFQKEKVLEAQKLGYHRAARMYIEHAVDDDAEGEEREEAISILKSSSDKGYGPATELIANKFYKKANPEKAIYYYLEAAKQGELSSIIALGNLYRPGEPVFLIEPGPLNDMEQFFYYFSIAKESGYEPGAEYVSKIEKLELIEKERIDELSGKAKEFSEKYPPVYYFDKFNLVF